MVNSDKYNAIIKQYQTDAAAKNFFTNAEGELKPYVQDFESIFTEGNQEKLEDFKSRNVEVIGVSTDTEQSHWGWLQMPKNQGGIQGVSYPLVADTNKTISSNYDVLAGDFGWDDNGDMIAEGELIAYRGLFLIDREGLVRHQLVNDLPLGRNVDEALRMVDALQHLEEHGEVCPANWTKGADAMNATHEGVAEYLSSK